MIVSGISRRAWLVYGLVWLAGIAAICHYMPSAYRVLPCTSADRIICFYGNELIIIAGIQD